MKYQPRGTLEVSIVQFLKFHRENLCRPDIQEPLSTLFLRATIILVNTHATLNKYGNLIRPLQQDYLREKRVITLGRALLNHETKDTQGREADTVSLLLLVCAAFNFNIIYYCL